MSLTGISNHITGLVALAIAISPHSRSFGHHPRILAREVSRSNHGGPCPPGGLGNVEVIVVDAADLLVDSIVARSSTWNRIRLNLSWMPEAERPVPETLEVDYDPCAWERSGVIRNATSWIALLPYPKRFHSTWSRCVLPASSMARARTVTRRDGPSRAISSQRRQR